MSNNNDTKYITSSTSISDPNNPNARTAHLSSIERTNLIDRKLSEQEDIRLFENRIRQTVRYELHVDTFKLVPRIPFKISQNDFNEITTSLISSIPMNDSSKQDYHVNNIVFVSTSNGIGNALYYRNINNELKFVLYPRFSKMSDIRTPIIIKGTASDNNVKNIEMIYRADIDTGHRVYAPGGAWSYQPTISEIKQVPLQSNQDNKKWIITRRYSNGVLAEEYESSDAKGDIRDGYDMIFDSNGDILIRRYYKNNKLNGVEEKWVLNSTLDSDGEPGIVKYYIDDKEITKGQYLEMIANNLKEKQILPTVLEALTSSYL